MKFSILTAPYLHHSLEFALDSIAGNGFTNVELWAASPHYCLDNCANEAERSKRLGEIKEMLASRGLSLSMFHPEQHRQYPYNIASENAHIREHSLEHMKMYMEDALTLGTDKMILCPGWEFLNERKEENYKRAVEGVCQIAECGKELGVTLYIEEMSTLSSPFVDSLEKLSKLIHEVNMDNVKVCMDTYLAKCNQESYESYKKLFGAVDFMHFSDSDENGYTALGQGDVPLKSILSALEAEDYDGCLSISLWGGGYYKDPDAELRKTAMFLAKEGLL